jgi:hypothetical protein
MLFLIGVADSVILRVPERQGALRFAEKEGGPFLREEGGKRSILGNFE